MIVVHQEPLIQLRRIRSNGAGYDAWNLWAWSILDGDRRTGGTFEGAISPAHATRKLARIVRRPNRQIWTQVSNDEMRYK